MWRAFSQNRAASDSIIAPCVHSMLQRHIRKLIFTFPWLIFSWHVPSRFSSDAPGKHQRAFIAYVRVAALIPSIYVIVWCLHLQAYLIFQCCLVSAPQASASPRQQSLWSSIPQSDWRILPNSAFSTVAGHHTPGVPTDHTTLPWNGEKIMRRRQQFS